MHTKDITKKTHRDITNTLGWRVEYLRDHVNQWTQQQLAGFLSENLNRTVSQGYVSKIEKNRIDPPSKVIKALSQIFQVNGEYLLILTETPEHSTEYSKINTHEAGEIALFIDSLEPELRNKLWQMNKLCEELLKSNSLSVQSVA